MPGERIYRRCPLRRRLLLDGGEEITGQGASLGYTVESHGGIEPVDVEPSRRRDPIGESGSPLLSPGPIVLPISRRHRSTAPPASFRERRLVLVSPKRGGSSRKCVYAVDVVLVFGLVSVTGTAGACT